MHRRVTAPRCVANNRYTCHMNDSLDRDLLPIPPQQPMAPMQTTMRWLKPTIVIALSLLLHLALFDWLRAPQNNTLPHPPDESVIIAALLPPIGPPSLPPPTPAKAAPTQIRPSPTATRVARPAAPPAAPPPPTEVQPLDDALPSGAPAQDFSSASPAMAQDSVVFASAETTASNGPASGATAAVAAAAAAAPVLRFAPPPSAELKYDVQALRDGKTVFGSGKISWKKDGDNYEIDGEAGVLFFSVLTFKSEGSLDAQGITPLRYSEKRFRKSPTNTHFQREPQRISFSASTLQYPRNGGEQDRASIIWQLVGLGRADPAQFGDGLDIFVAGVRDGDTWHVQILGEEKITVGGAAVTAWHLLRTPRAGSYDTQVDIWLAPSRDWYPVKLRQTERNGDYLDMSMSSITALAAQ